MGADKGGLIGDRKFGGSYPLTKSKRQLPTEKSAANALNDMEDKDAKHYGLDGLRNQFCLPPLQVVRQHESGTSVDSFAQVQYQPADSLLDVGSGNPHRAAYH